MGGNRIEIILPKASNEEVEEVKKMLTDVGSLEFRILANHKHDSEATQRAGAGGSGEASTALQMGTHRRDLDRHQPSIRPRKPSPTSQQEWKKDLYASIDVTLTGKDTSGNEKTESVKVHRNTTNTLSWKSRTV